MKYDRMRRVNELIKRELSLICERDVVPEVNALLTITNVDTAPDLRTATVDFSVLGSEEDRNHALKVLRRHRKQLQAEINRRVQLKYTPVLTFHIDRSLETADRVLTILDELDLSDVPDASEMKETEQDDVDPEQR